MHWPKLEGHFSRWCFSFVVVVAVHLGLLFVALNRPAPVKPETGEPMAAIMVELAPVPVAPSIPPVAARPGERQEEQQAAMPEPELIELPSEQADNIPAEVVLPVKPEPVAKAEEVEPELKRDTREQAPVAVKAMPDDVLAAPAQAAVSLTPSPQVIASWQALLLGHLERYKRYPRVSRRRRQEDVVYVRVQINRDGSVVDSRIEKSSRYKLLNRESLALIERAQPLPPPPEHVKGELIELVVPVEFSLRR